MEGSGVKIRPETEATKRHPPFMLDLVQKITSVIHVSVHIVVCVVLVARALAHSILSSEDSLVVNRIRWRNVLCYYWLLMTRSIFIIRPAPSFRRTPSVSQTRKALRNNVALGQTASRFNVLVMSTILDDIGTTRECLQRTPSKLQGGDLSLLQELGVDANRVYRECTQRPTPPIQIVE